MQHIDAKTLATRMESRSAPLIIDVLPRDKYRSEHLPGAKSIPYEEDDFVQRVQREAGGKEQEVLVYCASEQCDLSPKAGEALESAGFEKVIDFEAGIEGWKTAGYRVESGR